MRQIPVMFPLALAALPLSITLLAGSAARARETTPSAETDGAPLLRQMVGAINAADSATLAALYAETGVHEDVPTGVTARGRDEIAAFVDSALGQFRDVRFEPISARQSDDLAVLEYAFSVTDRASGRPISYRGVLVFELDEDLIRRSADYYDLAVVLGQQEAGGTAPQTSASSS